MAQSNNNMDLFEAVKYAVNAGADIVSMSWGSPEFPEETMFDSYFTGAIFLGASGDQQQLTYPSASPNVISVGGTSLYLNSCGNRVIPELVWSGTGAGISKYEPKPYWQNIQNFAPPTTMRTGPDVAFFADPFPGVYVYTSIPIESYVGWLAVGGTSLSTPCWAAIIANSLVPNKKVNNFSALLYNIAGGKTYTNIYGAYYDVLYGNNGMYQALQGFDYASGLGTPVENNFIRAVMRTLY